jgi:protein-disulfide isomerase
MDVELGRADSTQGKLQTASRRSSARHASAASESTPPKTPKATNPFHSDLLAHQARLKEELEAQKHTIALLKSERDGESDAAAARERALRDELAAAQQARTLQL